MQRQLIARALNPEQKFQPPSFLRLPILRNLPARLIGLGVWRVQVNKAIANHSQL